MTLHVIVRSLANVLHINVLLKHCSIIVGGRCQKRVSNANCTQLELADCASVTGHLLPCTDGACLASEATPQQSGCQGPVASAGCEGVTCHSQMRRLKEKCTGWEWQRRLCCRLCGTPAPKWVQKRKESSMEDHTASVHTGGAARRKRARAKANSRDSHEGTTAADENRERDEKNDRKQLQLRVKMLEASIKYFGENGPPTVLATMVEELDTARDTLRQSAPPSKKLALLQRKTDKMQRLSKRLAEVAERQAQLEPELYIVYIRHWRRCERSLRRNTMNWQKKWKTLTSSRLHPVKLGTPQQLMELGWIKHVRGALLGPGAHGIDGKCCQRHRIP
eukprot:6461026-Amphidinium_carterae.1